jgi:hypothetical protein
MKQLGLVGAGSRRERSALTKSETRKFINQLIAHPRIRQKASELRPHEDISGYVIDHDLSPCQVFVASFLPPSAVYRGVSDGRVLG